MSVFTKHQQLMIIAVGDKIDAINAKMDVTPDGIEWRMLKLDLADYTELLNKIVKGETL